MSISAAIKRKMMGLLVDSGKDEQDTIHEGLNRP
jgi:hypothetical protein